MSSKQTIYIAGPVTGHDPVEVEKAFRTKEAELIMEGYRVLNPVALVEQYQLNDKSWEDIMEFLLPYCISADILYLLPGSDTSEGSKVELYIMQKLKKQIMVG